MFPDTINLSKLNDFQKKVHDILMKYFNYIIPDTLSNKSYIDEGVFLDFILKKQDADNILSFSIKGDELHINTKYYDIYVLSSENIDVIDLLCKEVLLGHYKVYVSYDNNGNFLEKKTIFDDLSLHNYNDIQKKFRLFKASTIHKKEEIIKGLQWIDISSAS